MGDFARTPEVKVLRDCIHGYIHVDLQVVWDCINAREFQRLRRIHQLGGDFQVYHTGEHSRFSHSLGVYEITRRILEEVPDVKAQLSDTEQAALLCAALLHDLGHGPFSHFFETISHVHHEEMTRRILLDENTEIHQVLEKAEPGLAIMVANILQKKHPNPLPSAIISSQLDADRMDYLLRDAYCTGTSYGTFDLERILRTLRVKDGKLCVKKSGMHSVEDYIMARYHMYFQVYLHPDATAFEILIDRFFSRYRQIRKENPIFLLEPMYENLRVSDFLDLDEARLYTAFQLARSHPDAILSDLAGRILDRHLFDWVEEPTEKQEEGVQERIREAGLDPAIYVEKAEQSNGMYLPYLEGSTPIWILDGNGNLAPISCHSEIVKALEKMEVKSRKRLYFPKELAPF